MKRFGLRMSIGLWEKVKDIAKYKGYTMNRLILDVLWDFVEQKKPQ